MSIIKGSHGTGIEICFSWRPTSGGEVPPGALRAGDNTFVMRANHNGEYIPGKLVEGHEDAYYAYGGEEQHTGYCEALVETCISDLPGSPFEWKSCTGGEVPKNAIVGGSDSGKPLFIARGWIEGETVVGKVFPEHGCAYFPWGGEEHRRDEYEVLTANKRHV